MLHPMLSKFTPKVNEGRRPAKWMLTRPPATVPLNRFNPARMAYVWPSPVKLRGISLAHPNAGVIAVDQYIGTGDPKVALADDAQWKEVGPGQQRGLSMAGYFRRLRKRA